MTTAAPPKSAAKPAPHLLPRSIRNCSLTLVLLALFLVSWAGQFVAGRIEYNADRAHEHLAPLSALDYLASGHFWQATAENWESEFLQMAMFVVLTISLYQKGSPESHDPDGGKDKLDEDPALHKSDPRAPWPVRRGGWVGTLYSHSLSLTLLALFAASVCVHAAKGAQAYNEQRAWNGHPAVSVWGYARSSAFWFESLQNWQSEFLSIAAMVYLSVYLRQRGSPESKPVHTPHSENR